MKIKEKDKVRSALLEKSSTPYGLIKKSDGGYILVDYNKSFKNSFINIEITDKPIYIKDIFENDHKEIIQKLDDFTEKTSSYIYNNKKNKCYELEYDKSGDYFFLLAKDCTELKNLQNTWQKTEALYKAIFNSGTQAIIFVDMYSKIIAFNSYANELAKKVFNLELKIGDKISEKLPEIEVNNFTKNFQKAMSGERVVVERNKEIPFSQKKEWFELIYQNINNEESNIKGVCLIISSITSRKRYEQEMKDLITALKLSNKITDENIQHIQALNEELAESEIELKAMNAKKDKFFSIIAHDLKNPFQGFLGLTKDLADNFHHFSLEELNDYFISLHDTAKQLYKLLENLLLWSRVQRNSIDFKPEDLNLYDLVSLNIDIQKLNIERKSIRIINNIDKDVQVFADLNMLNTIIRNLLSNAVKFTKRSGKIEFNNIINDESIKIQVTDNGVGMNKETMNQLFRIDKQVTTKGTENESGTGLGLILCQELVEQNGGSISVDSEQNVGTTFTVTLPVSKN